jgi:hypothetical protein
VEDLDYPLEECSELSFSEHNKLGMSFAGPQGPAEIYHRSLTKTGRGPEQDEDGKGQAPESKPCIVGEEVVQSVRDRIAVLERRKISEAQGTPVYGVVDIQDGRRYARSRVVDVLKEKLEGEVEDQMLKRGLNCFLNEESPSEEKNLMEAGMIPTGWRGEKERWLRVDCILDSGASESVCPMSMCPLYPISDSPGSVSGLHYTSANGGRIKNRGQQSLPVELSNGTRSKALFQVADVTRPLVSVAAVCATGNVVIFGVGGGVIRNLETNAETPFVRRDGIYMFQLWIPPPEAAPGFAGPP